MKAIAFLKSLLPNFSKGTVIEDCRLTKLEITSVTQPSYENALRIFDKRKFQSKELINDFGIYQRMVKPQSAPNTIVAIERAFKQILSTLDTVETLIEKNYNEEIAGAGVTYYKAAVLQMLESIAFASKYARKYLNYVLVIETTCIDDPKEVTVADELAQAIIPADIRWIKDNFVNFCSVMATLTRSTDTIKNQFESIPDINITDTNASTLPESIGESKIDPFSHGFVPLWMNPIYHVRMAIAEYQVARLNAAKEEKQLLELRKLRMERQLEGKKDAGLEKQIDYIQGRIEGLESKIREKEEQYA